MNQSGNGINPIRYINKMYPAQDQQLIEFQDNYVFKTNPSFQLSQQTSKHMPKSQNWFKTKQDTILQQQTTGIQRKKRNRQKKQSIDQSPVNLQLLQSTNPHKQITQLIQQVNKLNNKNTAYQVENEKLKKYIEFLQDYNLKLKKQLMTALRRRNIQDQLQPTMTHHFMSHSLQRSPRQQIFQSKYMPKPNLTPNQCPNIQPHSNIFQVPSIKYPPQQLKSIYRTKASNNGIYPHEDKYSSAFTNKYISQFHQLPQKQSPYYWSYKNSQKLKNNPLRKILPTSLQSSMLGRHNQLQQSHLHSNYHHLNTSMPITQNIHTPTPHNQYLQNVHIPPNYENNKVLKSQQIICHKCLQTHPHVNNSGNNNKKKTKQKTKSTKTNKTIHNKNCQQFICPVHNRSKKSKSVKSTIPTRSKTLDKSSQSKYFYLKQSNNLNSSKSKTTKYGQKITISQFCI